MNWLKKKLRCMFKCKKEKKWEIQYIHFDGKVDVKCKECGKCRCGI